MMSVGARRPRKMFHGQKMEHFYFIRFRARFRLLSRKNGTWFILHPQKNRTLTEPMGTNGRDSKIYRFYGSFETINRTSKYLAPAILPTDARGGRYPFISTFCGALILLCYLHGQHSGSSWKAWCVGLCACEVVEYQLEPAPVCSTTM